MLKTILSLPTEMSLRPSRSRSSVSREAAEASAAALQRLLERRFDDVELVVIYIDGMHFGDQCVLAAVGVDTQGRKHVLALREGASENAEAAKDLLAPLVAHGVDPARRRLCVIDGSKARRTAINAVFGEAQPVQRCRNHKRRNVLGRLPREQQAQTASLMRAAWKLGRKRGWPSFVGSPAGWNTTIRMLRRLYWMAGRSVSRSIGWTFRVRCIVAWPPATCGQPALRGPQPDPTRLPLASRHAGALVRGRVSGTEKSFRKIMAYRDLWALQAILDGSQPATRQAAA